MEGTGVTLKSPNCKSHCSFQSNPFELLENSMDIITASEQANRRSSIGPSRDFFDISRKSLSFSDFGVGDFGKESMGILPADFGRNSSGFMNLNSSEFGRESLGILKIDALRDSLSFRRESVGIFNLMELNRESLNSGRESLGILHLKPADFNFIDEKNTVPDILLTAVEKNEDYLSTALNRALLNPHPRKTSSASSSSSVNPFNSFSLEGPSKIYSLSSMRNLEDTDILNRAFFNTNDPNNVTYASSSVVSSIHSPFNKGRLFSPNEFHISPARIKSLPVTSRDSFEDEMDVSSAIGRHFWTANGTMKTRTLEKRNFHGILDFGEDDTSNDFHDSVFIEGHHIAEKIADGSILNDSVNGEIGILDSTPQPEWPDEISENEDKERGDAKCNTETVFKNVDKLLPAPISNTNFKIKTSKADSNLSNETCGDKINISEHNKVQTEEKSVSKPIHDVSDIADESKKLSISHQAKSKDAKEILYNLSEIINCTNRSELQKSEGQYLLNSLADILCENNANEKNVCLDDSGHSSIIDEQSESTGNENQEYFKVVNEVDCNKHVFDKENVDLVPKAVKSIAESNLTQSFSSSVPNIKTLPLSMKKRNSSTSGLDLNKNKSTASNNSSVNSNDSKNSSNSSRPSFSGALRRKTLCSGTKKGPLKAVIPIGDMKKQTNVTPERTEQKMLTISNRTSTPIKEPKLKPMAASTPTGRPIKQKTITPISPLARPNKENASFTTGKAGGNTSPLTKTAIKPGPSLLRRNSVSEMKRTSKYIDKIARSNSIEKGTGIMSSLAKVRQNIVNSPYYQSKKQNVLKEINSSNIDVPNSKEKNRGNRSLPEAKLTNQESKFTPNTCLNVKGNPIKRPSSISKCVPARKEVINSYGIPKSKIHKLTGTQCQSSNTESKSVKPTAPNEVKKIDDSTNKPARRNSLGIMSSLPKIRHNILSSPHYQLEKQNVSNEGEK